MKYERPDFKAFEKSIIDLLNDFKSAESVDIQNKIMSKINELRTEFETMQSLAEVRYSINTEDKFYEGEQDYFDEVSPSYENLISKYYQEILDSKFRNELELKWGKQIFNIAYCTVKTISDEVIKDMERENSLVTEYDKMMAQAIVEIDGEKIPLTKLDPFLSSSDRSIRKKAVISLYTYLKSNMEKFDKLYDDLVKVRTTIAKKLGFKNFVELGYLRLTRTDFNASDVSKYRDQIKKYIVPVSEKLINRQKKRIGVDSFMMYDKYFEFKTGNPKPKGSPKELVEYASKMYNQLSTETGEFFKVLVENELMDLESKKGKMPGGYCTSFDSYKLPFIFSNFNGTSGDVDVLTHEFGHAFQSYMSNSNILPEYGWPTLESAEIHSMSMEFICWPWMELFFKEEADKYRFSHLSGAINFLPYGVSIDEFQHFVYENPEKTPEERREFWKKLEKKYRPFLSFEELDEFDLGLYWFKQGHVFSDPFYYIDYTLAQINAFEFWKKINENKENGWKDYITLCKKGGSESYLNLLKTANLTSPFKEGSLESIVKKVEEWLDNVDDIALDK